MTDYFPFVFFKWASCSGAKLSVWRDELLLKILEQFNCILSTNSYTFFVNNDKTMQYSVCI